MYVCAQVFAVQRGKRGCRVFGIARLQFGAFGKKQGDEAVGNGFGYDDSFGCVARLTRVAETRITGFDGGAFEIRIGHDDEGVAAAEFEDVFFEVHSRMGGEQAAGPRRAGKRHRVGVFNGFQRIVVVQPRTNQREVV